MVYSLLTQCSLAKLPADYIDDEDVWHPNRHLPQAGGSSGGQRADPAPNRVAHPKVEVSVSASKKVVMHHARALKAESDSGDEPYMSAYVTEWSSTCIHDETLRSIPQARDRRGRQCLQGRRVLAYCAMIAAFMGSYPLPPPSPMSASPDNFNRMRLYLGVICCAINVIFYY